MPVVIPEPYFENVPQLGNLKIDYIILDYDYPVLFTCTNEKGELFLCDCCDTLYCQRWLIAPVTKESVIDLLTNKVCSRDLFENAKDPYVACWTERSSETVFIPMEQFDPEDMPDKGCYLDAEDGDHDDYIKELQSRKDDPHVTFPR